MSSVSTGPDMAIPPFTGTVTRLTDGPVVAADMFGPGDIAGLEPDALANTNGPSVIRMPDWAAGKQAAIHMYFAHHKGRSIRLAYADRLDGPWAIYPDPIMPLANSLFAPEDPVPDPEFRAHLCWVCFFFWRWRFVVLAAVGVLCYPRLRRRPEVYIIHI